VEVSSLSESELELEDLLAFRFSDLTTSFLKYGFYKKLLARKSALK
jgi:hypothetical protein